MPAPALEALAEPLGYLGHAEDLIDAALSASRARGPLVVEPKQPGA